MTKKTSKIIALAVLAIIAVGASGCVSKSSTLGPLQSPVRSTSDTAAILTCPNNCDPAPFPFAGVAIFTKTGGYHPNGNFNGAVTVSFNGNPVKNTDYKMLWRVSRTDFCCATKVVGDAFKREFPCDSSKTYSSFTVYLNSNVCSPADNNHMVTMTLLPDGQWH